MIVFAGLFGVALTTLRKAGKEDHVSPLIHNVADVTTVLVTGVARFTAPAVGSLVLGAVASNDINELGEGMGSLGVVAAVRSPPSCATRAATVMTDGARRRACRGALWEWCSMLS